MLRTLTVEDKDQVIALSRSLWENDYLPDRYESRVQDRNWSFFGLFEDNLLIGIIALQRISDASVAWVKSLRVHPDYQRKGHGLFLVKHIIDLASQKGCSKLLYATGGGNESSKALASKAGFEQVAEAGYFRLERPYPPHPKPSPSIHPLKVDADRIAEIIKEQSSLVPGSYLPYAWNYEVKDIEGLKRISKRTSFYAILNEKGSADGLFFKTEHDRQDMKTASYTVFCKDKSIFIDIMSRILDELEQSDYVRSAFFLGPNAVNWAPDMMIVPEVFKGRRFPLYELDLRKS
jgi:N-acetylglutamate synthase-like GNAT family acetyltransferase